MENYIQELLAQRIGGKKFGKDNVIYKFEKIKRAKREATTQVQDMKLIDLGVGEPDAPASPEIVKRLQEEAGKKENRFYSDNGIEDFKKTAVQYMENVFGVKGLDYQTEVNHAIGSKPALAMLPLSLINPGDVAILTVPGYPVLGTHTNYLGGEVFDLPLKKENNFLPDLSSIPNKILKRAKILLLNYPNNPTGKNATSDFYKQVIDFALKNKIVIIQDAAYASLVYNSKPLSFLSVDGAKEVGVEVQSLSKAFNMTGWRLAFVAGNSLLVKAFATIKDNYDSGQFIAIQKAGIYALNHPEITELVKIKYERRLNKLVKILNKIGFDASVPDGTFYLYVKAPKGIQNGLEFKTAEDVSQYLIKKKLISTVPWDDVGHFLRFSVTFEAETEADEDLVLKEVERRLSDEKLIF